MKTKECFATFVSCMKKVRADIRLLRKGQKSSYDLLQLSHRLEKGLLIQNPKSMWGWEKAERMAALLKKNKEAFSSATANAVLSAYLDAKSKSQYQEDLEKHADFMRKTGYQPIAYENVGGTITVNNPNFSESEQVAIHRLFDTRHSCREFADRHVSNKDIETAVQMALRCPSACNRQPFRVYAIDPAKLAKQLGRERLQYEGDRTIIITGDVRAFTNGELLDWIVSPSIFAGYLTLAFHSLGIGNCVIRKDLVKNSAYNEAVRRVTGMDESEQIILELFIGYYKDEFIAPASNRLQAKEIVQFI